MAVNGAQSSGLLGGIGGLGSLFSGFHADGGTIPAGHWGVAGEAGAEIINGPATVTPMKQINAALNSGNNRNGPANVYHSASYNIDARGAQVGVAEQISSAIQSHQAYLERNLPAMINKSAKRYG